MSHVAPSPEISAIRAVRIAAHKLDMACTAIVGALEMRIGKENIEALAEPVPEDMLEMAAQLQGKIDGMAN